MFPLSSPPLPPHCSALFPPNTRLPPSSHQSIHICFSSFFLPPRPPPLYSSLILPPPIFFPLEIVICKALCSDSPYLCHGVAASLSLSPFLSILHEVLAQTGTSSFLHWQKKKKKKTMCTTLKQQQQKTFPQKNSAFPTLSQFSSQD